MLHQPGSKLAEDAVTTTTREFVRLALDIADRADPKRAPPEDITSIIIIILEDVIQGRREYGDWNESRTDIKNEEYLHKTQTHEHFKSSRSYAMCLVLKRKAIENSKQVRKKSESRIRGAKGRVSHRSTALENIYSGLDVEEPSFQGRNETMADIKPSRTVKPPPVILQYELETSEDEADFALWAFLSDCQNIRLHLQKVWQDFKEKKLSLSAAAQVTEVAFRIINRTSAAFIQDHPNFASFDHVAKHLDLAVDMKGETIERASFNQVGFKDPGDNSQANASHILCVPAYACLSAVRYSMCSPEVDADVYTQDRAVNHAKESHPLMMAFPLMAMLANLCHEEVNETLRTGYVFDTFTLTVHMAIGRPNSLPIGAVVCTQAYMDIIDAVGASQLPSKSLAAMKN
ncbi:Hypothetical predicted protein [Lecanosticta acicola]|uniref:DUF6604 domain-containing protein n=1 Tax=Lecanosticta acicola TaxID=111012 RepID=A0AAI8Z3H7_9PEZI|nr:Hypothetical predicted protein [Lecanosticta acicola]